MILLAKNLATLSCLSFSAGWKLALKSHPRALELSVRANIFLFLLTFLTENNIVMTEATNSRRLIEALPLNLSGIFHCHASPRLLKPPSPYSQASDQQKISGNECVMFWIEDPSVLMIDKKSLNKEMSSLVPWLSFCGPNFFESISVCLSLFRKYLLRGIIKAA